MTPEDIAKGLGDTDEFMGGPVCRFCASDTDVQLVTYDNTWDLGPYGPRSAWLCKFCRNSPDLKIVKEDIDRLSDTDEFIPTKYCDRCDEPSNELTPVDPYEPRYSSKLCPSCLDIVNQGPSDDKWLREGLGDKDEFRSQFAQPISVVGYAYGNSGANVSLIYDFDDGARVYYLSADLTKFVLREPDGTIRAAPQFSSSHDAPVWFDPYYQGMMVASVHEKDGKGVWRKGSIQPFNAQQRHEWTQAMKTPVAESLGDKDEFGKSQSMIKPIGVYGSMRDEEGMDSAMLTFEFEDGVKVYYLADNNRATLVLREVDGTTHKLSSPPGWEEPYYNGIIAAAIRVHPVKGAMWIKGSIPPFTSQERSEWAQVMGGFPLEESVDGWNQTMVESSIVESFTNFANIFNERGIKPFPSRIIPTPKPEPEAPLPSSSTELSDVDQFEDEDYSPCEEPMGRPIALHDSSGKDITAELGQEFGKEFMAFPDEHPRGFETGGCVAWVSISKWPDLELIDNIYYWRGMWHDDVYDLFSTRPELAESIETIDEAMKPPTLASSFNTRGIKPYPEDPEEYLTSIHIHQEVPNPGGLSDVDEFEVSDGGCESPLGGWNIILRDPEGNDVTKYLEDSFRELHVYVDYRGPYTTIGHDKKCVVWVEVPILNPSMLSIVRRYESAYYDSAKGEWVQGFGY